MNTDSDQQRSQAAHDRARSLVVRLMNSKTPETFSAQQLLAEYPQLRDFPSCVVDLAYEEFCRSREAGRPIGATEFAGTFPDIEQSLYRVIEFDQILHEHPSLIEEVPEGRWPEVGDTFCDFELLEQIGRGALSRVFLARQPNLGQRQVVVKVCVRGEREADLLGQLQHAGIAPVHSIHADEATGLAVICMPFLTRVTMHQLSERLCSLKADGARLQRLTAGGLREQVRFFNLQHSDSDSTGQLPEASSRDSLFADTDSFAAVILKWAIQLAKALSHAHKHQILHCDVKPGNVLLLPDLSASLLDFNLAWSEGDALRLAGGTLPYMASEQLRALIPVRPDVVPDDRLPVMVSEATDVFGLCATIWHVATGHPPFGVSVDAESRTEAVAQMLDRHQRGISSADVAGIRRLLPKRVVEVLLRGLQFDAQHRPPTADALVAELECLLHGRKTRWSRRVVAGAAIVACLTLFTIPMLNDVARSPEAVARELMSDERFQDALDILSAQESPTTETNFLRLSCRTCLLPPPTVEPAEAYYSLRLTYVENAEAETDAELQAKQDLRDQWQQIAREWLLLTEFDACAAEAWLNLAFVHLELDDTPAAAHCFKTAVSLGLYRDNYECLRLIAEISGNQTRRRFRNTELLAELRQALQSGCTRGEALAFIDASVSEYRLRPRLTDSEISARLLDIANCLTEREFKLEPEAIWKFYKYRPFVMKSGPHTQLFRLSEAGPPVVQHRLGKALQLPPATAFPPEAPVLAELDR